MKQIDKNWCFKIGNFNKKWKNKADIIVKIPPNLKSNEPEEFGNLGI